MNERITWWYNTSENDLRAARILAQSGDYANAVFHCQQAVEKILKAYLLSLRVTSQTHSCIDLLEMVERNSDLTVSERLKSDARKLDLQYIPTRYPNGLGGDPSRYYDRILWEELSVCAERIFQFIQPSLEQMRSRD